LKHFIYLLLVFIFFNSCKATDAVIFENPADLGYWRHNSNDVDTDKDGSVYNQLEIKQTVKYSTNVLKKNNSKIILGFDFHSTYKDVFNINKTRENITLPNYTDKRFQGLEINTPNYIVNESSVNSNKPVSKARVLYGHNAVGITYEIGDATPKNRIETIGKISAELMMKILTKD